MLINFGYSTVKNSGCITVISLNSHAVAGPNPSKPQSENNVQANRRLLRRRRHQEAQKKYNWHRPYLDRHHYERYHGDWEALTCWRAATAISAKPRASFASTW